MCEEALNYRVCIGLSRGCAANAVREVGENFVRWPAARFEAVVRVEQELVGMPEGLIVEIADLIQVVLGEKRGHFETRRHRTSRQALLRYPMRAPQNPKVTHEQGDRAGRVFPLFAQPPDDGLRLAQLPVPERVCELACSPLLPSETCIALSQWHPFGKTARLTFFITMDKTKLNNMD